jgi:3-oxoisoapionate kinase
MTLSAGLPAGVLVAFYGDDFTGSSAVMEVMTFAGLPAVMFVETPAPAQLQRFAQYRAIGIASVARAQPPSWMDAHLPPAFRALAELRAPVTHYKTCSTLDSSPTVGSIGRAVDIGVPIFSTITDAATWQPLIVAAPPIGRYQAFGNLFAAYGDSIHRLDRHPVMRQHPVTPMQEADVGWHIGQQTGRPIGLVDLVAMKRGQGLERFEAELLAGRSLLSLDVVDDETLQWVGELIWSRRGGGVFAVGSQGVEYALVAHWRAAGVLPKAAEVQPAAERSQIVAASGSVSPLTAAQIDWASNNGFDLVLLAAEASLDDRRWQDEIDAAVERARASLSSGRSPLVVTARGPQDAAVARFREMVAASGRDSVSVNACVGGGLGEIVRRVVADGRVKRAAVSGGDSSGFAMRALGAYALEAVAPIAPGAPLCRVFSTDLEVDGLEIALKGGQMGDTDFFGSVRAGRAATRGGMA